MDAPELNGLLPGGSSSVFLFSSPDYDERWAKAESKTAELLGRIQPSRLSEERRQAVIDYLERLIRRDFDCKVFPIGSVPFKTYLPNGDIDLTACSGLHRVNDSWATHLCTILENEEGSQKALYQVNEVKCIHAEVPVVKCLVEKIIVDISFNQLGGLNTLCFLDEVDMFIDQNHLFKRSVILVKAWCFYESRILGAYHGLLSTYALETLVLYVFHVFHWSLRGPFEVLFRFLEFFSRFDWNQYCLSLWGPIPLISLHNMSVESPSKHGGGVLLSEAFLNACKQKYSVHPGSEGTQGKVFSQKFMNVIDPLRSNNNLGRSVNKGNFVRIHSAFAYGAAQLEKLLQSPEEHFSENLASFFRNTERHSRGYRPDAPALGFEQLQFQVNAFAFDDKGSKKAGKVDVSKQAKQGLNNISILTNGDRSNGIDLNNSTTSYEFESSIVVPQHKRRPCVMDTESTEEALESEHECNSIMEEQRNHNHHLSDFDNSPDVDISRVLDALLDTHCSDRTIRKSEKTTPSLPLQNSSTGQPDQVDPSIMALNQLHPSSSMPLTREDMYHNPVGSSYHLHSINTRLDEQVMVGGTAAQSTERGASEQISAQKEVETGETGGELLGSDFTTHSQISDIRDTEADILRGDFTTHLHNLQVGCFLESTRLHSPLRSSSTLHPKYTHEKSIWEGTGRPGTNPNIFTQLSSCRNGVLSVSALHGATLESTYTSPNGLLADGIPKFHKGTGTFFPNVKPAFERARRLTPGVKGRQGTPSLEFHDPMNHNGACAVRSRYHGQKKRDGQALKARSERSNVELEVKERGDWNISREASVRSNAFFGAPSSAGFFFYPSERDGSVAVSGEAVVNRTDCLSPVMMLPSGNNKAVPIEKLEFGSLGPFKLEGFLAGSLQDVSIEEERIGSVVQNQSDPQSHEFSSTKQGQTIDYHQSPPAQGSYLLKDEDFPPLTFCTPRETSTVCVPQKSSTSQQSYHQACLVGPSS